MTADPKTLQAYLADRGFYRGAIDGLLGKHSMAAVDTLLSAENIVSRRWTDERKLIAVEQLVLKARGFEIGAIDGLAGPQTRYIRELAAAKPAEITALAETRKLAEAAAPKPSPKALERWPHERDAVAFFGAIGSGHTSLLMPYPMRISYEPNQVVSRITCHKLVSGAVQEIFERTRDHYGLEAITNLRLDLFGGCYSPRRKRGGSSWSTHAYAAAVDIDPDRNQLKWGRDLAALDAAAYEPFWSFVEATGAVSLGRACNIDWMHFQFMRLNSSKD